MVIGLGAYFLTVAIPPQLILLTELLGLACVDHESEIWDRPGTAFTATPPRHLSAPVWMLTVART